MWSLEYENNMKIINEVSNQLICSSQNQYENNKNSGLSNEEKNHKVKAIFFLDQVNKNKYIFPCNETHQIYTYIAGGSRANRSSNS